MDKDTSGLVVGVVVALVGLYLAVKFIGAILGFIIDHPLFVAIGALAASFGAAAYFGSRK